jgi:hypothetical protein
MKSTAASKTTFPPSKKSAASSRSARERIRQIEAKSLCKMRHPTRIRKLEGFIELPGA